MTPVDFYTKITRRLQYIEAQIEAQKWNPDAHLKKIAKRKEAVIAYCTEPRTTKEICAKIGMAHSNINKKTYINELVNNGQLRITNLLSPNTYKQRYVNADAEVPILSEEALIEFCKTPRRRKEIQQHFNVDWEQIRVPVTRMVAEGKLLCNTEICEMNNHYARYVATI